MNCTLWNFLNRQRVHGQRGSSVFVTGNAAASGFLLPDSMRVWHDQRVLMLPRLPFKKKKRKKNRPQNTLFSVKLKSASNFPQAAPSHVCLTDDQLVFWPPRALTLLWITPGLHVHARLSFKARVPHVNTSKRKCYRQRKISRWAVSFLLCGAISAHRPYLIDRIGRHLLICES